MYVTLENFCLIALMHLTKGYAFVTAVTVMMAMAPRLIHTSSVLSVIDAAFISGNRKFFHSRCHIKVYHCDDIWLFLKS